MKRVIAVVNRKHLIRGQTYTVEKEYTEGIMKDRYRVLDESGHYVNYHKRCFTEEKE